MNMLEMIFAATLFSIIVVALMGVWSMHARAVAASRSTIMATHLAESVLENALSKGWRVRSETIEPIVVTTTLNDQESTMELYPSLVVTRRITLDGGEYKALRATVRWKEGEREREVSIDTIITWQG